MRAIAVLGLLCLATTGIGCGLSGGRSAPWIAQDEVEVIDGQISVEETTSIEAILQNPEAYVGKTLLVEGEVTGRCQGSGCWVSLDTGNPDSPFYAKSSDHSFVFPSSCEQKRVWVQGVLEVMQPEPAEDHEGEAHEEYGEGHVCPAPVYFLEPQAAVVRK